jgi:hypothetical protein
MRVLDIPPLPRQIEIPDLENLLRTRISEIVVWPNQAIPLLGAMCHPNDEAARDTLMDSLLIQDPGGLSFRTSSAESKPTG